MRSSRIKRSICDSTLLLPGFEIAPVTPKRKEFVPVWISCLGVIVPTLGRGRFSFGVHKVPASILARCMPRELGGEPGLFGKSTLAGILCAPYPKSPVSRRILAPVVAMLKMCPGVNCVFFANVSASVRRWFASVLAKALRCPVDLASPLRVGVWCKIVGSRVELPSTPASIKCKAYVDGIKGVLSDSVLVAWAKMCYRAILDACKFLDAGCVPMGGLALRRPILALLLDCLIS